MTTDGPNYGVQEGVREVVFTAGQQPVVRSPQPGALLLDEASLLRGEVTLRR
jgi:hypothetical protein